MATQPAEEPLVDKQTPQDDSFYETIDRSSEFDNNLNSKSPVLSEEEIQKQREEWTRDLTKLEEEIRTLQSVLSSKIRCASELKRKLGITAYVEFKQDVQYGVKSIKDSDAYRKTNEQLAHVQHSITSSTAYQKTNETLVNINESIQSTPAYQKTSDAFKSFGAFASKKIGDARNSTTFKSFEDKMGGAYSSVKSKVTGSRSENSFQELQEAGGGEGTVSGTPSPATTPGTTEVQVPPTATK